MKINAAQLLLDDGFVAQQTVLIADGKIMDIYPQRSESVDAEVAFLVPSYIDLQVNGGAGILFGEATTAQKVVTVADTHAQYGCGAMLPTLITNTEQAMAHFADAIHDARQMSSAVIGVHFEGPWLASAKRGIHLDAHIRAPTDRELALMTRQDLGAVLVTLAPETVPVDVIADLVEQGVTVSIGHSNAEHELVLAALAAGATGFTHLYNAMSGLQGRMPGVLGAALSEMDAYAGIIVDHQHVSPYAVQFALRNKTPQKLCLVTDAMAHVGQAQAELPYFDGTILREGNRLTTPEGALAGSCLDMHQAVLNMHRSIGASLADSINMASRTPANWLKHYDLGRIALWKTANLLGLNSDLIISHHWRAGCPMSITTENE